MLVYQRVYLYTAKTDGMTVYLVFLGSIRSGGINQQWFVEKHPSSGKPIPGNGLDSPWMGDTSSTGYEMV